jgi:hypothetical protein
MKPTPEAPKGARITMEAAIFADHVDLVDPVTKGPTKASFIKVPDLATGGYRRQRVSETTQSLLPIPEKPNPYKDQKDSELDTSASLATQETWSPVLGQLPFPVPLMNQLEKFRRFNKESHVL